VCDQVRVMAGTKEIVRKEGSGGGQITSVVLTNKFFTFQTNYPKSGNLIRHERNLNDLYLVAVHKKRICGWCGGRHHPHTMHWTGGPQEPHSLAPEKRQPRWADQEG